MNLIINNVKCDAFTHLDKKHSSGITPFSLSEKTEKRIVVYLYCDNKPFPVSNVHAECYIDDGVEKVVTECIVGKLGEINVVIPDSFLSVGKRFVCEINISSWDDDETFRLRATDFVVTILK